MILMKKLFIFLLLGFLLLSLFGYFCAYKILAPRIEADIKNKVQNSLVRNNLPAVQVETDGRDITLRGEVGSEQLKAKALRVATVAGYHTIVDNIVVAQVSNNKFELTELADSEESRQKTAIYLEKNLPKNYMDSLDVGIIPASEGVDGIKGVKNQAAKNCQKSFKSLLSKNKIHFKTARAILIKESSKLLDQFFLVATSCPDAVILIEGYTDSKGSKKSNKKLSQKRAQAVVNYLKQKGIAKNKLKAKGYGEEKPIATNRTPKGRALNRRIEFTVEGVK